MNTCYLDANILVALKDENNSFHQRAEKILHYLIEKEYRVYISPLCIDECMYILLRLFKTVSIVKLIITEILFLPNLSIINPSDTIQSQLEVMDYMQSYKLKPRDAYHLSIMKAHNIEHIATFDSDFEQVFIKGFIQKLPTF